MVWRCVWAWVWAVNDHWTGLLKWTTEMEYWTDAFCLKTIFILSNKIQLPVEPAFCQEWYIPDCTNSFRPMVKGWWNAMGCFFWSVKRSSSLGSSTDNRVVGHNSGLILGIKDHICRYTAMCPVASYMLITQCTANVLWCMLDYGPYQQ